MWATVLAGGDRGVVLFNRHLREEPTFVVTDMSVSWPLLGLPKDCKVRLHMALGLSLAPCEGEILHAMMARLHNEKQTSH